MMKQKAAAAAALHNLGPRQQQVQRPVQVRTVFVPPPMNNMQNNRQINVANQVVKPSVSLAVTSASARNVGGAATAYPLNIPNPAKSGITITPLSNGKQNVAASEEVDYEDVELDEDDDQLMEDEDDEYNEITEAPADQTESPTRLPINNLLPNTPCTVSGSVTLHRLLNKKPEETTISVPLPLHTQPITVNQVKPTLNNQDRTLDAIKMEEGAKSLTNSTANSSSTVNSTTNSSRRNSVESVASVTSTASSGQPKARKSFNPNSRTSSPMLNGDVEKKNLPQVNGNGRRLGSVDSNNSEPESVKRGCDSVAAG